MSKKDTSGKKHFGEKAKNNRFQEWLALCRSPYRCRDKEHPSNERYEDMANAKISAKSKSKTPSYKYHTSS
jgi:hypothetical protein